MRVAKLTRFTRPALRLKVALFSTLAYLRPTAACRVIFSSFRSPTFLRCSLSSFVARPVSNLSGAAQPVRHVMPSLEDSALGPAGAHLDSWDT
jgi:hypothetical protein